MDVSRTIREKVSEAEARVMQFVRNLIQLTTVTRSTATGAEDGAAGWPDAGGAYQRAPRRMQHFGFRSRPPKNTSAVMLLVGGGSASEITVAEDDPGFGPTDLADGEMAIYSKKSGAEVRITADGEVKVTAGGTSPVTITAGTGANVTIDAGAGGSVVLQGGTLPVARQTDTAGPYPIVGGNPFVKA